MDSDTLITVLVAIYLLWQFLLWFIKKGHQKWINGKIQPFTIQGDDVDDDDAYEAVILEEDVTLFETSEPIENLAEYETITDQGDCEKKRAQVNKRKQKESECRVSRSPACHSIGNLRQAIIWSEILAPPVGLREDKE